ncbi:Predicted O-methyltransferase YrrM [Alteribacillus persepolensis]|uniref:tRNA 5-hydroxyuridine methyltransferase n=1 Tax=Alteribacillus persepolensis TaxID=568899 RepID=A0A1G8DKF7_9BACI|nr:O-methyltransferase [Alteribacillus persepolensis]SDH58193.1 Predicted O-methyltransferase YrrM [Alteribacillus persepolensis]
MDDRENINSYIRTLHEPLSPLFEEMEKFAEENNIPIMEFESLSVVLELLEIYNSQNILEIGTAIGYSALRMAEALPKAHVVSLEKDPERYSAALDFKSRSKADHRTRFILADALDETVTFDYNMLFDVLFIDAAKGKYHDYFRKYTPFLQKGGLVITDNVLFKGYTVEPEKAPKRIRSMVKKIHSYNTSLAKDPSYRTSFLPVGDGLAISQKLS